MSDFNQSRNTFNETRQHQKVIEPEFVKINHKQNNLEDYYDSGFSNLLENESYNLQNNQNRYHRNN